MNNYNWMPLSEARRIMLCEDWVWWRDKLWPRSTPHCVLTFGDLDMLPFYPHPDEIIVCRALVPEVPSFEEQSK